MIKYTLSTLNTLSVILSDERKVVGGIKDSRGSPDGF